MRVVSTIALAALCAGCGLGPTRGKLAPDGSADVAPPVPFVPYTPSPIQPPPPPPFEPPPAPPSSGGAAVGGAGGMAAAGGMAGPGMPAAGQGGLAGQGGGAGFFDPGFPMPPPPPPIPPPPIPPFCDGMAKRPLPYAIATDFRTRLILLPGQLTVFDNPICNQTLFPDAAPPQPLPVDAGLPGADDPVATATTCTELKYHPDDCVLMGGPAAPCWSGVIFSPSALGFMGAGICIEPGAKVIHFKARASKDNARVKFGAIREGVGATEFWLQITRVWRSYTITIPDGEDYDNEGTNPGGVLNGFSVVLEPQDHAGATYVLVADVIWARE